MFVRRRDFDALVARVNAMEPAKCDTKTDKPDVTRKDVEIEIPGIGERNALLFGLTRKRIPLKDAVLMLAAHLGVTFDVTPSTSERVIVKPLDTIKIQAPPRLSKKQKR